MDAHPTWHPQWHACQRVGVAARGALAAVVLLGKVCVQPMIPLVGAVFCLSWLYSGPLMSKVVGVELSLKSVRDDRLPLHHRIAAAQTLLALRTPQATTLLKQELAPGGDVGIQQAIVKALAEAPQDTLGAFEQAMFALLDANCEALIEPVAEALGRIEDKQTIKRLIGFAQAPSKSEPARCGAILAMGHHPRQEVVAALMALITDDQPAVIRLAALDGLRWLTGRHDAGDDQQDWQAWWKVHRSKRTSQWQAMLLRNFVIQAHRSSAKQRGLEKHLVDAFRQQYLALAQNERPALLVKWLHDEVQVARLLAMELTEQRLIDVDAPPIGDELRQVLRSLLDDPLAVMRCRAAKALSDVRDEQAAQIAARQLGAGHERDIEVLRALLKLIRKVPRPEAVVSSMRLLSDPRLRSDAADALAEAVVVKHDAGPWLTPQQTTQLAAEVRRHLVQAPVPNPSMIRLLGRIATSQDWQHIRGFLDSEVDAVKDAAARAWAESDQALKELVARGHDPVIQPFLYDAISQRGWCAQTLMHLVANEPQTSSLRQAREQAILAMVTRVSPEMVVLADEVLSTHDVNDELREKLLAAAIGKLQPEPNHTSSRANSVNPDIQNLAGSRPLIDLLLSRAELRLANGQAKLALATYDWLSRHDIATLTLDQWRRCELGGLRSHFALGDVDTLLSMALPIVSRPSQADGIETQVMNLMLDAAHRSIEADQVAQARHILVQIADGLAHEAPQGVRQRIDDLQAKLEQKEAEKDSAEQPSATSVNDEVSGESPSGTERDREPNAE